MCGIVAAISQRNIISILINGLKRLEYRGYDSAGVVCVSKESAFKVVKKLGKVSQLESALAQKPISGHVGIAHTRWATHGRPCEKNAHPHITADRIAIVHNGIIENYDTIKTMLIGKGFTFLSLSPRIFIILLQAIIAETF